jgi:hypothetical protein
MGRFLIDGILFVCLVVLVMNVMECMNGKQVQAEKVKCEDLK